MQAPHQVAPRKFPEFKRRHYLLLALCSAVFFAALYIGGEVGIFRDKNIYPDDYTAERSVGEWHYVEGDDGREFLRNRSMPQMNFVPMSVVPGADFLFLNVRKSPATGRNEYTFSSQQAVDYCAGGCQFTIQNGDREQFLWRASSEPSGVIKPFDQAGIAKLIAETNTIYVFLDRPGKEQIHFRFDLEQYPTF